MHQSGCRLPDRRHAFTLTCSRMTSADTSAPSFDPSFAEPRRWPLRRLLAPFAVGFALLSACLTFVVLTGLTPIEPTRSVVVSFLLINAATILLLVGIIVREVWQLVQARRRGTAACADRQPIFGDCGAAGRAGVDRRQRHHRSRPRPAVLRHHQGRD